MSDSHLSEPFRNFTMAETLEIGELTYDLSVFQVRKQTEVTGFSQGNSFQ